MEEYRAQERARCICRGVGLCGDCLERMTQALREAVDFCHEILDEHQPEGPLYQQSQRLLTRITAALRR